MIKRNVLIGLLILLVTIFFVPLAVFAQQIKVPNVVNVDITQAKQAIEAVGLKINVSYTSTQDQKLNGKVASQNHLAGQKLTRGYSVSVAAYQYQALVTVPSILLIEWSQAKNPPGLILSWSGYTDTTEKNKSGKIATQTPVAGMKVAQGSLVKFTTYSYIPPITVPNIVNMDLQQAEKTLQSVGLKYERRSDTITSDQKLSGKVADQVPSAGGKRDQGNSILVSIYQYQPLVTVPDILNMNYQQAEKTLQNVGLTGAIESTGGGVAVSLNTLVQTTDISKHDTVASQTPSAGQKIPKGTTVYYKKYFSFEVLQNQSAMNQTAKTTQEKEQTMRALQDQIARTEKEMQKNKITTAQKVNQNISQAVLGAPAAPGGTPQSNPGTAGSQQQTQTQQMQAQVNTTVKLNITWGTPPYTVTSSDPRVVTVDWDNAAKGYKLISKSRGTSVITVTDSKGVINRINFNAQ